MARDEYEGMCFGYYGMAPLASYCFLAIFWGVYLPTYHDRAGDLTDLLWQPPVLAG